MIGYKIKSIKNKIKMAYQRAKRGYADQDVWDLHSWFMEIMPKMLQNLKDTSHGFPIEFKSESEWFEILERMIFLLHEMDEDSCTYKNPYEDKWFEVVTHQKRDEELVKMYLGEEKNKWNYINLCKKEFFDLFSKYFYNLWD